MDWSLYRCGTAGHLTYTPDEPDLREYLHATAGGIELWRCLRCGAFVPGQPHGSGPAAKAPAVRRGKEIRSEIILRFFAVERLVRFVVAGALAVAVWRFRTSQLSLKQDFMHELPILRTLFRELGINIDRSGIVGLVNHALRASPGLLLLLAIFLAVYSVVELIEGIGLWLAKRWGEYFAAAATSLGLPYEVYEIVLRPTWTKLTLFLINLALVLYLVLTRRLFGARGGKAAYEARLRRISVIDEANQSAAVRRAALAAGIEAGASANDQAAAGANDQAPAGATDQAAAGATDQAPAGASDQAASGASDLAAAGATDRASAGYASGQATGEKVLADPAPAGQADPGSG